MPNRRRCRHGYTALNDSNSQARPTGSTDGMTVVVESWKPSLRRRGSRNFPMDIVPAGPLFPVLEVDRQLVRYIYRNGVSNACKYGKKDGVVSTRVAYDRHLQLLTMQFINLPGESVMINYASSQQRRLRNCSSRILSSKATQEGTGREIESIPNESSEGVA